MGMALLVALAGLGACTGENSRKSSSSAGGYDAPQAPSAAGGVALAGGSAASAAKGDSARVVVRTASIAITTKNVDVAADKVASIAREQGGRVDGDNRSGTDASRTATLVVRVLPVHLERAMTLAAALGRETRRSLSADDVTQTKVDLDARVSALATSVTRLRELLRHSANVQDLLGVETQLSSREADLESMRAKQAALAGQVALASLTVTLSATSPPPPKARVGVHPAGFITAFAAGAHAVAVGFRLLAAGLGYSLPVLGPLALLLLLAWRLRRRRRASPAAGTAPPAGPPTQAGQRSDEPVGV